MATATRPPNRVERHAQATALLAEGLTRNHVAARLGIKPQTLRNILNDPDGSKDKARKASYGGRCSDCGRRTDGSNGREKAPTRCKFCTQGIRPPEPDRRRRVPVRLTDFPLEQRLEAAHEACRYEKGELERTEILFAALTPSDRVYWVAA